MYMYIQLLQSIAHCNCANSISIHYLLDVTNASYCIMIRRGLTGRAIRIHTATWVHSFSVRVFRMGGRIVAVIVVCVCVGVWRGRVLVESYVTHEERGSSNTERYGRWGVQFPIK